jgi:hypothetical protein
MTSLTPSAATQRLGLVGYGGMTGSSTYNFGAGISAWATQAWTTSNTGAALVFETTNNNTAVRNEKMRIDQNGYVGIGTSSPSAPLHVTTSNVSGNIATFVSTGSGGAGCSISWNGTACSSDARLKENVHSVDTSVALDQLLTVRSVHFTWIKDKDHEMQTGFIAQELEKIFPEFVKTDERGFKQVNYAHFVSVLTASVQELQKKWSKDSLELHRGLASVHDEVATLKTENEKVKAENAVLKARLDKQDQEIALIKKALLH